MWEIGRTIGLMVWEPMIRRMVLDTKVSGKTIFNMDLEKNSVEIILRTRDR